MSMPQFVKYLADHPGLKPNVTFEAYGFRESSSLRIAATTYPRGEAFIFPEYFAFLSTRHDGTISWVEEMGPEFGKMYGKFFLKLVPYHAGTAVSIAEVLGRALGRKYREPKITKKALTGPVSFFFPLSDLTDVVSGGGGWAKDRRDAMNAPYFRLVTPDQTYLVQMAARLSPTVGNIIKTIRQHRGDWQPRARELLQAAVARNKAAS